jgi:hypothetical protein
MSSKVSEYTYTRYTCVIDINYHSNWKICGLDYLVTGINKRFADNDSFKDKTCLTISNIQVKVNIVTDRWFYIKPVSRLLFYFHLGKRESCFCYDLQFATSGERLILQVRWFVDNIFNENKQKEVLNKINALSHYLH